MTGRWEAGGAQVGVWPLWIGLFGAPAAWSFQMLVSYPFLARNCYPGNAPRGQPLWDWAWPLAIAISALALAGGLAAGWVAVRSWRATQHPIGLSPDRLEEVGSPRARFMAFSGVFVSAVFVLGIIFGGLGIVLLTPCVLP